MEPEASLIRSDRRVELDTETTVYLYLAGIIYPWNTEHDSPFRFDDPLHETICLIFRVFLHDRLEALKHFLHCLKELFLTAASGSQVFIDSFQICIR